MVRTLLSFRGIDSFSWVFFFFNLGGNRAGGWRAAWGMPD